MPVAEVIENFIDHIDKPLPVLLSDYEGNVTNFQKDLRKRSFRVRGELERDINSHKINPSNYSNVFSNVIGKIERLLKDRFYNEKEKICYRYDTTDLVIDQFGPDLHQFAYQILVYCNDLLDFFNHQKTDYYKIIINNKSKDHIQFKGKIQKNRTPSRQSFQLVNNEVNLNLVHKILRDAKIIDQATSYENFEKVFSGDPVSHKVIWLNANSLHYFIREIVACKGRDKTPKGVKNPNEGKWARAIKCFKKIDGEFNISELKNTKPPASSRTNMLDLAIEEINGH